MIPVLLKPKCIFSVWPKAGSILSGALKPECSYPELLRTECTSILLHREGYPRESLVDENRFEPPFARLPSPLPAPMAPVPSSPPPPLASADPLSPILPPLISSPSPSHLLPRPGTPWPHAFPNLPPSTPSITSSADLDYPPLSAIPRRRRSSRSFWPPAPVEIPLASGDPPPSPSIPPLHPDPLDSGALLPAKSMSPPPVVSCATAVNSSAPGGLALLSVPSSLVVPSLEAGLPISSPPESVVGRVERLPNRIPCPVGPSSSSSILSSGLQFRSGGLEPVEASISSQLPSSSKLESVGSPLHNHDLAGLILMPS